MIKEGERLLAFLPRPYFHSTVGPRLSWGPPILSSGPEILS